MPTYVYRCDACKETFEITQKVTDPPLADCELCATGEGQVHRVIQPVAIAFKGPGFHTNDYANKP